MKLEKFEVEDDEEDVVVVAVVVALLNLLIWTDFINICYIEKLGLLAEIKHSDWFKKSKD